MIYKYNLHIRQVYHRFTILLLGSSPQCILTLSRLMVLFLVAWHFATRCCRFSGLSFCVSLIALSTRDNKYKLPISQLERLPSRKATQ